MDCEGPIGGLGHGPCQRVFTETRAVNDIPSSVVDITVLSVEVGHMTLVVILNISSPS